MIENNKKKVIIMFGMIIILIIFMALYSKCFNKKQQVISLKVNMNMAKGSENLDTKQEYTADGIILYNTIFVPLNTTFRNIYPNQYKENQNQRIISENMVLDIDFENNMIEIPDVYKNDKINQYIDDSINIEIENIDGIKYVPLYLISNLPRILVKINNNYVYVSNNYKTAIDELKENYNNKITIYTLENSKKNSKEAYNGERKGALWREEALKRIEKYRKENIEINIVNQNRKKLDANVSIKMKNNKFKFGTAIQYLNNKNDYTGISKKHFNAIGSENLFKWKSFEIREKEGTNNIYEFAKNNDYHLRGHNLWWDYIYSKDLKNDVIGDINNVKPGTMCYIYKELNTGKITKEKAEKETEKIEKNFENIVYEHIEKEVDEFNNIDEWDVINEGLTDQYFKYYLFDKEYLEDGNFINEDTKVYNTIDKYQYYIDNDRYYKFLANCFEIAKKTNPNATLLYNDNVLTGNNNNLPVSYTVNIINNIKKYTDKIDSLGIQYHSKHLEWTPQSYYNQINKIKKEVGLNSIEITEYTSPLLENNKQNNSDRANYLEDTLIECYSNQNIDEFTMWVFNGPNFTDEERKAYEETVYPWLNYSENGEADDGTYSSRLYKGTYEATITLPNGKSQVVNFEVSDDSSDTIEVVFDSNLQNISIKEKPKTEYYKNEKIDLTKGSIIANYDDGTSKEIKLTENDIKILNFDTIDNGKKALTIQYNGCNTSYDINVKENIKEDVNKIINENNIIKNKYASVYRNENVEKQYNNLLNYLNETSQNQDENSLELLNKIYVGQLNLARTIVDEYNKNNITIKSTDYEEIIKQIIDISDDYKDLYKLYISEDNLSNKEAEDKINNIINRYNDNIDIDLSKETDLINKLKELYGTLSSNDDITLNYLNKQRISKTCEIVSLMLENDIKNVANSECRKITITSDSGLGNYTNHDEAITINLPKKAKVISDNGASSFIFTENGTKEIKINNRGYDYTYRIVVSNINKQAPEIKTNSGQDVKIDVSEDNLKEIKIEKDGEETKAKIGQVISVPGIYKITATDKAGNSSNKEIIVYKNYTNEQNSQIKYITIKSKTKVRDIKQDGDYTIKDNNNIANEIKRAPSSVNTNAEKDSNSYIATGDILQDNNNTYIVITLGDLSGNGDVGVADIIKLRKSLVGLTKLTKLQELAADTNQNGRVNVSDLLKERKIMVGME